jgi:aminopeptidase N
MGIAGGTLSAAAALLVGLPAGSGVAAGDGAGSAGLGDPLFPAAGNGGYQVEHYESRLTYHRSGAIAARVRIDAEVDTGLGSGGRAPELVRFNLDFTGPRLTDVTVDGRPAAHVRRDGELVITPRRPLPDRTPFEVELAYRGTPPSTRSPDGARQGWIETKRGAVTLGQPRGTPTWLPSNDHPSDKATMEFRLRTPRGRIGIANGRLSGVTRDDRWTTTRWRPSEPMATYLALVAIGRFRLDRGSLNGTQYVAAADRTMPRGALPKLRRHTASAHRGLTGFAGPYPFAASGGVITGSRGGYALETQDRPVYPAQPHENLVVHEIAHQWFGNSLTPALWGEIWLSEGFATYSEWLIAERRGERRAHEMFGLLYRTHSADDRDFWHPPPGSVRDPAKLFSPSVYTRGAMALHAIRRAVGDRDFFRILARWVADNRHANVTSEQFLEVAEEVSGEQLGELYSAWVYEPGRPPRPRK